VVVCESLLRRIPRWRSGAVPSRRWRLLLAAVAASLMVLAAPASTAVLVEPIEGEWEGNGRVYRIEPVGPQEFRGVIVEKRRLLPRR
jgi:hypothetical protein